MGVIKEDCETRAAPSVLRIRLVCGLEEIQLCICIISVEVVIQTAIDGPSVLIDECSDPIDAATYVVANLVRAKTLNQPATSC